MKQFLLAFMALALLTGCSTSGLYDDSSASVAQEEKKKPSIPQPKPKPRVPEPRIPASKTVQANLLGVTELKREVSKGFNMERLVQKIDKSLAQPNVIADDIKRGWYYGEEDDKRIGTPSSWIWINDGIKSRWSSPDAIKTTHEVEITELCRKTGGRYVASCIERETGDCEYISESECRCTEDTIWMDGQGCILMDDDDEFVTIDSEELRRGWYNGKMNEKKLNTPLSWIWLENGEDSRWQNPSPID